METEYLRYFEKLAETENMTKAAKLLNIAQPSLSRTLKNLEETFQAPLFDRNGKSLHLNAAGKILLNYTKQILPLIEQAHYDILSLSTNTSEITINMLYSNQIFPNLVANFTKSYPQIKVNLSRFISDELAANNCDIIIHASEHIASQMTSYKLMTEECLIGVSSNHPFANLTEIPLDALKYEQFIILNRDNILGGLTLQFFKDAGFSPKIAMECDNQSTVASFVSLNLGIALFPASTWVPSSDDIVYKSIAKHKIYRSIYITPTKEPLCSGAKVFWEYTTAYFDTFS